MKTKAIQANAERVMVRPDSLDAFISTCDSNEFCGKICRALGGQSVELNDSERWLFLVIKGDIELLNKRSEARKEAQRVRQAEWRKRMAEAVNKQG